MGINPTRKPYGRVNRRWLVTEHAVGEAVGCTLPNSVFGSATGVSGNIVPAGYPVVVGADGKAAPYTSGNLSGFTLNPVDLTNGDDSVAYVWHGTVDPSLLPVAFDPATVTGVSASRFKFDAKA